MRKWEKRTRRNLFCLFSLSREVQQESSGSIIVSLVKLRTYAKCDFGVRYCERDEKGVKGYWDSIPSSK